MKEGYFLLPDVNPNRPEEKCFRVLSPAQWREIQAVANQLEQKRAAYAEEATMFRGVIRLERGDNKRFFLDKHNASRRMAMRCGEQFDAYCCVLNEAVAV